MEDAGNFWRAAHRLVATASTSGRAGATTPRSSGRARLPLRIRSKPLIGHRERDGTLVTTLDGRSAAAHQQLVKHGTRRPATEDEFNAFKALFGR